MLKAVREILKSDKDKQIGNLVSINYNKKTFKMIDNGTMTKWKERAYMSYLRYFKNLGYEEI